MTIRWGYRYVWAGAEGSAVGPYYVPCESREEAEKALRKFSSEAVGQWDTALVWRTAAVPAGPWQEGDVVPSWGDRPLSTGEAAALNKEAVLSDGDDPSPQLIAGLLLLVLDAPGIPAEVIATWTPAEREQAVKWVSAEHLSASDNDDVERVPQPGFVTRAAEICANPVIAQLAVEAWLRHREEIALSADATSSWAASVAAARAQSAIAGLLVLLKDKAPS
jgi:hypothetical protein